MKYIVTVTETLSRTFAVEADTEEEATDKVRTAYDNEEIVLVADDYVDTDFDTHEALSEAEIEGCEDFETL